MEENNSITPKIRLRELDFLRGIAIILVIFRHQPVIDFLQTMGWIGVDLFFVLSGFLVSGLLFREYQKFGSIKPGLFLIRRGFKIYPIFYLTAILYIIPRILLHKFNPLHAFYDLIFVQNYAMGWGYLYAASWSLAVEEHFYFLLAFLLWLLFNKKLIDFKKTQGFSLFEKIIVSVLVVILVLRIISNYYYPDDTIRHITMTHLRIDSLLFGVLIAYWYNFKQQQLFSFYRNNQLLLLLAFLMLLFTPFLDQMDSFFVRTIGFTMLYLSFGIILIHFLVNKNINKQINRIFSTAVVNFVSKIGFCSYSIYVIHSFIITYDSFFKIENRYLAFAEVFVLSIISGFVMTYLIEKYFLNFRDRFFPNRTF